MSHLGKGYDINQTFVVEPFDNSIPEFSACTSVYTNFIQSCSGDTSIFLGTGIISVNGNLSATTVSATTYYGDGSNLTGIAKQDTYVTGGTYSNGTAIFINNTGGTFNVNGFYTGYTAPIDVYVTGGTYLNGVTIFRNNTGGTFTVNGYYTGYTAPIDVFVTGGTYSNGTSIFTNNTGGTFNVSGFTTPFTGGTVSGLTTFTNGLTANTVSATTYYGDGSHLTGLVTQDTYVTGATYDNNNKFIFTNNTGGTFNVSFDTVSALTATNQITANIFSGDSFYRRGINFVDVAYHIQSTGAELFSGLTRVSNTQFNVGPVDGYVAANAGEHFDLINVSYSGVTNQTTPYLNTDIATYVLITSASTLLLQPTFPTPQQRRENIFLGRIAHPDKTSIVTANNTTDFVYSPMSALRDMFTTINLINQGVVVSTNGANLSVNTSSGTLWGMGINFPTNPLSPDNINIGGTNPATFQYRTQTGGTYSNTTTLDVGYYDNVGVRTAVVGTGATNQRLYLFPSGQLRMQYGQHVYSSLSEAVSNAITEQFVVLDNQKFNAILIGVISVVTNATDLSNTSQAYFLTVSKFGEVLGGTGGLSTTTLQQAYNNSTNPQITTTSILKSLQIKGGTGSDLDNNLVIQNNVGNITGAWNASGNLTATTVSATTYYNLPKDIFVTGGTYSNGTAIFTNNTGGTFNVSGYYTGATDVYVTGGTYSNGTTTFTNNTGGTFTVSGYLTGVTFNGGTVTGATTFTAGLSANTISATTYQNLPLDIRVTGGTYSNGITIFTNNTGGTFTVNGYYTGTTDVYVTGGTYSNGSATFTNNTGGTFTVTGFNTTTQGITGATNGSGISTSITNNNLTITNTQTQGLTGLTANNGISANTSNNVTTIGFSGGTIGNTVNFINGLTANTISATTYQNLPIDIRVTGGTYSNGSATFTNNTGGTFNVSGFYTGATDVRVTGGTYSNGTAIFTNNTGGTFTVTGFNTTTQGITGLTANNGLSANTSNNVTTIGFSGGTIGNSVNFTNGLTANTISATTYYNLPIDVRVTGGTYSNGTTTFTNNTGGTFNVSGYYTGATDVFVTGGTYSNGTATFRNNTGGTFTVTGLYTGATDVFVTGGTFNPNTSIATFTNNTGGTFNVSGINIYAFSGGTVTGATTFTNGLLSNSISATTYLNTPYWTSGSTGTYSIKAKNDSSIDATGNYSLAEGYATTASGSASHAEGGQSTASGNYSHAEGYLNIANNDYSHAEGASTLASGQASHSEGTVTQAQGHYSHAEGNTTVAGGTASHAENQETQAQGNYSHAEGNASTALGTASHAEGILLSKDSYHYVNGEGSHIEGSNQISYSDYNHVEGTNNLITGISSHVEGYNNIGGASYIYPITFFDGNAVIRVNGDVTGIFSSGVFIALIDSVGEVVGSVTRYFTPNRVNGSSYDIGGDYTNIDMADPYTFLTNPSYVVSLDSGINDFVHVEGVSNTANGKASHVGGYQSLASGEYSFVHGSGSTASTQNTIVLGSGLIGSAANTVYVPYFNIKYLSGGTSVNNLGIDADGYVVIGSAGGGTFTGGTVSGSTVFTAGLSANTISATTYSNLPVKDIFGGQNIRVTQSNGIYTLAFSGGTVTGATTFTGGLTSNTISATTYQNLPIDVRVTGGTYSNGTATFTNNTGGTFNVIGFNTVTQGITGVTSASGINTNVTNNTLTIGFSGGSIGYATTFTNGLTANTISATTYQNLPVSGLTQGSNITITNNGLGNYTISSTGGSGGTFTGGTVTGATNFTSNISASTLTLTTTPVVDVNSSQTLLSRDSTSGNIEIVYVSAITSTYNYGTGFAIANSVYLT